MPHTSCIQETKLTIFPGDEMSYADEMDPNTCPRCGNPVTVKPRGRPARWCSDRCRKLASEERRAAERGAIGLEIRDHTRVVEKPVPERMSATVAAARAAEDIDTALSVLNALQRNSERTRSRTKTSTGCTGESTNCGQRSAEPCARLPWV
uniref:hypothetical protein n=1 Tax=Rhodococcus erythropolis TaxID=1833 RepID=UPI00186626C0|nr:hypothetical protein [Rhodococcus erythropolis]